MPLRPRLRPHLRSRLAPAALLVCLLGACAAPTAVAPGRQPAAGAGTIKISSSPSGARLFLDGVGTGYRTPTTVANLAAGRHRLILSLSGHRNWEQTVELKGGATLVLAATLRPVATGRLWISSIPSGAEVYVDGESAGLATPVEGKELVVGTHTVQLRRASYEPWSQAVVVMEERSLSIQAVLTPSRRSVGHLAVQSRPPRARILIDGYPTGKFTPDTVFSLQAGVHRVELEREGHRTWGGAVTVHEGQTENLLVTLQPQPAGDVGGARVESDPPGAAVGLDGVLLRRKTPADIAGLTAGTHALELSRPGFRAWRGELTVKPGETTLLAVKLVAEGQYGGSLRVESDPPGASIAIDGRATGAVTPALLPNLPAAGHRLELSLAGHRPWTGLVHVSAGTTETARARLVPRPYAFAARVVAQDGDAVTIEVTAVLPDGGPADGLLAIGLPGGSLAEIPLEHGRARHALSAAGAKELSLSAALGAQREVFVLRRTPLGWEIASPEE